MHDAIPISNVTIAVIGAMPAGYRKQTWKASGNF
jgi:hypothetical protein